MSLDERNTTATAEATEALGEELAAHLLAGDVVLLLGELASGKTTLVRGLVRGLGGEPREVTSPSFVLVQSYHCDRSGIDVLHHVDLYRVADSAEGLRGLGLDELMADEKAVVAVEWPGQSLIASIPGPARVWRLELAQGESDDTRTVAVTRS